MSGGIALGNEEDADKVFGIRAPEADVIAGEIEADRYRSVCEELAERFPKLTKVAFTLRGSVSASYNTWSAVQWDSGDFYQAPQYDFIQSSTEWVAATRLWPDSYVARMSMLAIHKRPWISRWLLPV